MLLLGLKRLEEHFPRAFQAKQLGLFSVSDHVAFFPSIKMICLNHMIIYTCKKMNTNLYSAASLILRNPCHLLTVQEEIVLNWNKSSAGKVHLVI